MSALTAALLLQVSDINDTQSLKIEEFPLGIHAGINPYINIIVFPASANAIMKVEQGKGTLVLVSDSQTTIYNEEIHFDGYAASASYAIEGYITHTSLLFNEEGDEVTPQILLVNTGVQTGPVVLPYQGGVIEIIDGKLHSSIFLQGSLYLTYRVTGTVYNYNAAISGNTIFLGRIFAISPKNKKTSATYDVDIRGADSRDKGAMFIVYRDTVAIEGKVYELPDSGSFPTSNSYTAYSPSEEDKPPLGVGYVYQQWTHETLFIENDRDWLEKEVVQWFFPTLPGDSPQDFIGVKWKYVDKIPSAPTDTITQSLIDRLNAAKALLLIKYPG